MTRDESQFVQAFMKEYEQVFSKISGKRSKRLLDFYLTTY